MCIQPVGDVVRLSTTLEATGPAAAIKLTDAHVAALGSTRTPAVEVTIAGHGVHRGRVGRMGGEILIGFSKAARAELGLDIGQPVDVEIRLDTAPREVDVPPALLAALAEDDAARTGFDGLAPSHRKEYARWIAGAKKDETRDKRVACAVERLRQGLPPR